MKLNVTFTIDDGPAALTQVAACVGFANQYGIAVRMVPEDELPERKADVTWGDVAVTGKRIGLYRKAREILSDGDTINRIAFVRDLAKATRMQPARGRLYR